MTTRNIVILPPPEVLAQAMAWSRQIASEYRTNFILDGKNFYPHITLYQLALPDKNIKFLLQQLHIISKQTKMFRVNAEKFSTLVGFIFLNFVKNKELISLHERIVTSCNLFREGENIPVEAQNLTSPDVPEFIKHSIRTYGSALAMDAYIPHISICRLKNFTDAANAQMKLNYENISFDVCSVHVANIGPDGTVNEIYKEFPLQMI